MESKQRSASYSLEHSQWHIEEMDCPTEEGLIRKRLGQQEGITQLGFQLMQRQLTVVHRTGLRPAIEAALKELGFHPVLVDKAQQVSARTAEAGASTAQPCCAGSARPQSKQHKAFYRIVAAVALALVAEIGSWGWGAHFIWFVLALLAIVLSGGQVYKKGWIALKNRNLNINALMSIAVTGALIIGEWPEAAMVMSLFALAEWIEARSLVRARDAVEQLLSVAPDQVEVWNSSTQQWQEQDTNMVASGSIFRVRPGERIGLDGVVVSGQSDVNQAPITGESMMVPKKVGDSVYAGAINGMGELHIQSHGRATESTLARIAQAVHNAQQGRAALERFVDRFARIYTPIVVLLAFGVALIPPLVGGMGWFESTYKALVLLVIACPCALVISTPVAVVSALAVAARHGVLIKGGVYIERLRHLGLLALDKTGTVTTGRPSLVRYGVVPGVDNNQVLAIAYYLAERSDHPASVAVAQGVRTESCHVCTGVGGQDGFEALPGRGVQCMIDGVHYKLGQLIWAVGAEHSIDNALQYVPSSLHALYQAGVEQGASFVFLSANNHVLALFVLQDRLKDGVRDSIRALQSKHVRLAILSGDAPAAVAHVGQQLGINEVYGGLLPQDKLRFVQRERQSYVVGMVGDGINDAPALAEADIGFAMGSLGSDMAIETADVAIMNDDLGKIHWALGLSQRLHAVLVQNISAALIIKAVFLLWAVFGDAAMWMAVCADVGASLLVVANSLRLLREQ